MRVRASCASAVHSSKGKAKPAAFGIAATPTCGRGRLACRVALLCRRRLARQLVPPRRQRRARGRRGLGRCGRGCELSLEIELGAAAAHHVQEVVAQLGAPLGRDARDEVARGGGVEVA